MCCRECFLPCIKMRSAGQVSDIISYRTGYRLLEVAPALLGCQVHTADEPVRILHVSVHSGYQRRLVEVRSVRRGVDTVDENIVITEDIGEEIGIILLFVSGDDICLQRNRPLSRVLISIILRLGHEVAFVIGFHTRRTVSSTIGAEIEALHLISLLAQFGEFGHNISVERILVRVIILIYTVVLMVEALVFRQLGGVIMEYTGAGWFVFRLEGGQGLRRRSFIMRQVVKVIHLKDLITPEDGVESQLHGVCYRIFVIRFEIIDSGVSHCFVSHEVAVGYTHGSRRRNGDHASESLSRIGVKDRLSAHGGDRISSAARFVIVKQDVHDTAIAVRRDTSAGRERNILLVKSGYRSLRIILGEMRTIDMDIAVRINHTAGSRRVVLELAVTDNKRNIIFRRLVYRRENSCRVIKRLRPVSVHENTAAAEIGTRLITVLQCISAAQIIGVSAGDLDTVYDDGTCVLRPLAFRVEISGIVHRYFAGQDLFAVSPVGIRVFRRIFNRLRAYLGRVGMYRDHVIDMGEIFAGDCITG